jgi:hypothetical protein
VWSVAPTKQEAGALRGCSLGPKGLCASSCSSGEPQEHLGHKGSAVTVSLWKESPACHGEQIWGSRGGSERHPKTQLCLHVYLTLLLKFSVLLGKHL